MTVFSFDVFTAEHDRVKNGHMADVHSRVIVEAETYAEASETAGCLAAVVHGGMPTAILVRY